MKIHYFQRYHQAENVATANTMLLLSRLYQYSPDKFFQFLRLDHALEDFEPEISFQLQEKIAHNPSSVPDAVIMQDSFKIVVETKLADKEFEGKLGQLNRHLNSFRNETYRILLTLAPKAMKNNVQNQLDNLLKNRREGFRHVNLTFEELTERIQKVLDDRDQEMQDVLDDYISYCEHDNLFPDGKNWMWVQAVGQTLAFNVDNNLYYNKLSSGCRPYKYLGLYTQKSVRYIGAVSARFIATTPDNIQSENKSDKLTEEYKNKICAAMKSNQALLKEPHRYFFVEQFYQTDFRKETTRGLRGSRKFNLAQILNMPQLPSDTATIACLLKDKHWE